MRNITVTTSSWDYPVSIGSGLSNSLSNRLKLLPGGRRKLEYVLTSPAIWSLWGRRLLAAFGARQPIVLFVPSGEQHKRLSEIERLGSEMVRTGADRSSLLIAFGGGVIGDMGGFLAAIYMRGIDYVQIPTTFLAQVDSSVGGKTGVNLRAGKNLMGCFYPPRAVFADIDLLGTLPQNELHAGLYESIKAGLIRDAALFRHIEANRRLIEQRESKTLEKIVAASIRIKAQVVSEDERETSVRMILNFGHTIGHAIEATLGFGTILHGEAVAWGMLVALEISKMRNWLSGKDAQRAEGVIRSFDPPALPSLNRKRLLDAATKDKKNRAGVRRFVLLKGLGNAVVTDDVTDEEVLAALDTALPIARSGRGR